MVRPSEGQVVDTSKPRRFLVTAAPGQSIGLQICQQRSGYASPVPGNRCSMASAIMGTMLMGPIPMEEVASQPGTYQLATDSRCGLSGFVSNRPMYARAVAVPPSAVQSRDWFGNPDYFEMFTGPSFTGPMERLDVWGDQVEFSVSEPPSGFVKPSPGISVNDGAAYTNSVDVSVSVEPPACSAPYPTSVVLSNDGGFKPSSTMPLGDPEEGSDVVRVAWKLQTTGRERLPKTVYANIGGTRYTDDIILDQRDPVVESAALLGGGAASAATSKRYRVKLKATDSNSGVSSVQFAANKKSPSALVSYKTKLSVSLPAKPKWVRAQDKAGNFSRWKKLK